MKAPNTVARLIDKDGKVAEICTCAGTPIGPVAGHQIDCPMVETLNSVGHRRIHVRKAWAFPDGDSFHAIAGVVQTYDNIDPDSQTAIRVEVIVKEIEE